MCNCLEQMFICRGHVWGLGSRMDSKHCQSGCNHSNLPGRPAWVHSHWLDLLNANLVQQANRQAANKWHPPILTSSSRFTQTNILLILIIRIRNNNVGTDTHTHTHTHTQTVMLMNSVPFCTFYHFILFFCDRFFKIYFLYLCHFLTRLGMKLSCFNAEELV